MKEITKLVLLASPLSLVVVVSWLIVLPLYQYADMADRMDLGLFLGTAWAIGITISSAYVVVNQYLKVRVGLRLNDERSRMIALRAGYYSFWLSVGWWTLLNLVILTDTNGFGVFNLYMAPEALIGGLMALPVMFCLVWLYLTHVSRPGPG